MMKTDKYFHQNSPHRSHAPRGDAAADASCHGPESGQGGFMDWPIERIRNRIESVVGGEWGEEPDYNPQALNIAVIRVADISGLTIQKTELTIRGVLPTKLENRLITKRSLLVEKSGGGDKQSVGRAVYPGQLSFEAICSNFMAKLDCRPSTNPAYLNYIFQSLYSVGFNQACIQQTTGIQNLNITAYLAYKTAFPPLQEQTRIAAYLDASCKAIDGAIAAKQRQVENLDALLESTIYKAVTQGINPNVKPKPAGLDWLSEVPEHWTVQQIKRTCDLLRGKFTHRPRNDPALYDGEYPFVQTGDITAARKYIRSYSQTLNELGLSVSKMFPRHTLVMSIAANIGDVAILDFEACFPDSMVGLIPNHKTDLDFLYYLMRAMKGIMLRSAVLSTQLNLNYVRIGSNFAPFPPKKEQQAIAEFLGNKEREISAIKDLMQKQIDTLTAYRKSLIHECVTGKRRITESDMARLENHTETQHAGN